MNEQNIFDGLDPEIVERVGSRRDALRGFGKLGAGLALASVPLGFAAMAKRAFAQGGLPQSVVEILNFALTLEYLEAEFYILGTTTTPAGFFPSSMERQTFEIIRNHEVEHVEFLQGVLGAQAVAKPQFDFTAGGMFSPFTNYATFVTLSTAFEDTGVRAYKGQAPNLINNDDILTAALRIHSVEARHASKVRRLSTGYAEQGWIPFTQPDAPAAVAPVYQGEGETVQAGVPVTEVVPSGVTAEDVTEAFDEPLTMQQVLQIVDAFIVGDVDGDGQAA